LTGFAEETDFVARVPETEIERLKSEVSVERLVEAAGVALKRAGKDLLGRCPFHDDAEASLVVTPAKNLWHCFGCQLGGGPIDWVMKVKAVGFRDAVESLRAGASAGADEAPVKRPSGCSAAAPVALGASEQELLNQVIDFYHQRLLESPEAPRYLERRGLADRDLIGCFKLGFVDRTLGLRLPVKQLKAGAEVRGRLQAIGLLRASGHEHFRGCLTIPVIDESGNVTEVYGRRIDDHLREGASRHLYLPGHHRGPARGVWNVQALKTHPEIILCEALIDALTFWRAGYRNVTSAYGVEGFTDDILAAFKRYGVKRVLIAYDRDEAGERAAERLAERLIAEGLECYRIQFPKGMDANAYALKVTPAEQSLGIAIRKALWLGKGTAPTEPPGQRVEDVAIEAAARAPVPAPVPDPAPAPPLAASPVSAAPGVEPAAEVSEEEIVMRFGAGEHARRYRIRGLARNLSVETLKVNLLVSRPSGEAQAYYVDTLDLYSARSRNQFLLAAAAELGLREEIVKSDLGRALFKLEALQEARIKAALAVTPRVPEMADEAREAALALLRAPDLLERIVADFEAVGLVGERTNKLVGYLAAVSRKLDRPLGVVIQSSSAAGKTSLLDAVLGFVPEEERVKYSAMTGQSLFYIGETNLKHKVLGIVEEEGASRAAYALKLLQSEGELTIASTGKDPATGNLVTQEYRVEGPVALLATTTARDVDEELLNRCLVLAVDESRDQTAAIHRLQRDRRSLEGLHAKRARQGLTTVHQNAQRLLRPLEVLNLYAEHLTFPDATTRLRRDHEKYLTLIDTIAFFHQHQRPIRTDVRDGALVEYVEVTLEDIARANAIAHEVLGRSLDELPPQTRRLLGLLDRFVTAESERQGLPRERVRFSRRALREAIGWGDTQLKVHLARLAELEYLLVHRAKHGGFEYELVYELGEDEHTLRFPGLADVAALRSAHERARSGENGSRSAPGRASVGGRSASGQAAEIAPTPEPESVSDDSHAGSAETHGSGEPAHGSSYPQALPLAARGR
jgi:DNA primase catalytic core